MNIFADFHHPALYYSLYLLFEKRLGHRLFRPIGLDWYKSGYWKIGDLCLNDSQKNEKLAELLIPDAILPYFEESWNKILYVKDGYFVVDKSGNIPVEQRCVTFEQFKRMKFDLIIASFKGNIKPFKKLAAEFQGSVNVIVQVGNEWDIDKFKGEYILASVKRNNIRESRDILFYKQEFDFGVFKASKCSYENQIVSFVHPAYLSDRDKAMIREIEKGLAGSFVVKLYGKYARDGYLSNVLEIANMMGKSKFGLHLKSVGDGYGHVIHNWFAVGRPVIFRGSQYKNRLAGELLEDLVTGIDIQETGVDECIAIVKEMPDKEYSKMCDNVERRFKKNVDFDKDAERVKAFLEKIERETAI